MQLIEGINNIHKPFINAVVTIGNFDGVHIGHQRLFHEVIELADKTKGTSVAMTFNPHPLKVLKTNKTLFPLITGFEQKVELIGKTDLDVLLVIPFTPSFAEISARDFVEKLLIKKIGMKTIVVGNDYRFGKSREGDLHLLRKFGNELSFDLTEVKWVPVSGNMSDRISSTSVRKVVMDGEMEIAYKMLGRYYQVRGTVEHGKKRGGQILGFPTANIRLDAELIPMSGVYAVTVEIDTGRFVGVANIGYCPTFGDGNFTIEVHILDFNEDIYSKQIKVNFVKRLRGELKFNGFDELANQIKLDIIETKKIVHI